MRVGCVAVFCLLWLHIAGSAALGEEVVRVRAGNHPGFGRIVFNFPSAVEYELTRDGDHVLLRFDAAAPIGEPSSYPRNVVGYNGDVGQAEIVVAHNARIRSFKAGNGVAIDVWDTSPRQTAPTAPAATPSAKAANPAPPVAAKPAGTQGEHASSSAAMPASLPPAVTPVEAKAPPAAPAPTVEPGTAARVGGEVRAELPPTPQAASPTASEPAAPPPTAPSRPAPSRPAPSQATGAAPLSLAAVPGPAGSMQLAFGSATGLAALRRGATALLVFDERRPIDLAGLRNDPVFSAATVQLLPEATIVRLPLPPTTALALRRTPDGWAVTAGAASPDTQAITPVLANREVMMAAAPGRVLSVPDPDTGGLLLVATQREPGQAVTVARRTSEFELLATWQGVAVDPLSAGVFLRSVKDGFVLGAEPAGLALAAPSADDEAYAAASALTRRYDLPPLSPDALMRRLQGEVDAVAAAAPLARARGRRAAAQTMIALGLGAEAQSMLRLAATEDARVLDDSDAVGLSAIAALLAGRDGEADGLSDPRLDGTDEIAFWRAVRQAAAAEGAAPAASVFAATLPLLLAYPPPLRDRLLPLVAETLGANDPAAAGKLLANGPDDPRLKLARGLWLQAKGDRDGALAVFDQLAAGPDRLARLRAARRAVELRLAAGQIDARQAADALERQVYAWRGDRREVDLRVRAAELRAKAGEWRAALALLREAEPLLAEEQPAVHARLAATFAAMCEDRNADRVSPLDLVALLDEYADLLPQGEPGTELAARLADRLLALDLPRRAEAVLARLVRATAGPVRASFGVRLAGLRLREGSPADALATLADTDADALPEAVQQQRTMVRAGALARRGDAAGAGRLLAELGTDQAAGMRAAILEEARDWPQAEQALTEYAARTVPPDGALTDAQRRTLLRLAGATAQAGDAVALGALGRREGKRMQAGALGDMFRLLTASPVQGGADLPRAAREIALARSLPTGLRAMGSPAPSQ